MPGKRENVISWDEFFMRAAVAASLRSKDPNTQVGACIADTNNRILSVGPTRRWALALPIRTTASSRWVTTARRQR